MATMSKISQFVLGFVLAIALLFLAGAGLTRYMLTRLATSPPRPSFTNDPSPSPAAKASSPVASSPVASPASPVASPSPSPIPSPSPSPIGYRARVTQLIGLKVRQEPNADAATVGGVEYNQEITILEDSPDGGWQKIQIAGGTAGWIKSGNTTKVN
jgi:hypothetical protein